MVSTAHGDSEDPPRNGTGRPAGSRNQTSTRESRAPGPGAVAQPADLREPVHADGPDRPARLRHGLHARRVLLATDRGAGVPDDPGPPGREPGLPGLPA